MLDRFSPEWEGYIRPLALAAFFLVPGEAAMFVLWEVTLPSEGSVMARLIWAAVDAVLMTAAVRLLVGFIVGQRYEGAVAAVIASCCYATVLFGGILVCYEIDLELDLFGVRRNPDLFILTSIVPALLSTPLYGWLLHSDFGKSLLARIGL